MKKFIFLAFVIAFSMTAFSCVSMSSMPKEEIQISYDKSVLQNVSRVTDDGLSKIELAVSPDGNQLLYVEIDKSVNSYITNMKNSNSGYYYDSQMYLLRDISRPSKTPLGLTFSYWPAWNKNGKEFVFASLENNQFKLVRANIEGGRKTYITRTPIGSEDIRPDIKNNIILCQTKINGKNQIVTLNYDGTEITLICEGYSPSWHPRENKFVFIRDGGIFEMDLDLNQATEIYKDVDFPCYKPSYSKDGKYILFSQLTPVNAKGTMKSSLSKRIISIANNRTNFHLYLISSDGMNKTQLTSGSVDAYSPVWGADNTIFFISAANNKTDIWKAKVQY